MTLDERIHEIALDLIGKSSMRHDLWRVTSLGIVRPGLPQPDEGELPLVSASFPQGDWYLWTTRRLLSFCDGELQEVPSTEIAAAHFGMAKGDPAFMGDMTAPLQSLVATIHQRTGPALRLRYELGYASMAPIHCYKYWVLKHPVIHKLLIPSERATYLTRRQP